MIKEISRNQPGQPGPRKKNKDFKIHPGVTIDVGTTSQWKPKDIGYFRPDPEVLQIEIKNISFFFL